MKGWRTLIFNSAAAIVGVLMAFDWTSVASAKTAGLIVSGVSLGNMVLRAFTNTTVGSNS